MHNAGDEQMKYDVIDVNTDEVVQRDVYLYAALKYCTNNITDRYVDYLCDDIIDCGMEFGSDSFKIVVKQMGVNEYHVFTDGGDDIMKVVEHNIVTERTVADLYQV